MFSLNYAQHLGYLLCIVFPSPSILQHYAKFDIHTIATLEKLPGARSFGGFIGHLVFHQTNLFVFWVSSTSFCRSDCCPCILRMLGINHSSICHLLLIG